MAYDEGLAEVLREDLAGIDGISERKMFGGLCFLLNGNMLCGVHGQKFDSAGMFRVGKDRQAEAMAIEGAGPMAFTGRAMGGMVDADPGAFADDARRGRLLGMALDFVRGLPAK